MKITRNILLNPGPATTSDSVKLAQVVPDICPREAEFGSMVDWIQTQLVTFASCDNVTTGDEHNVCVLMGGSGTAAVESVISSVIAPNSALLVVNNGAYATRIIKIAKIYNIPVVEFESPHNSAIDYNKLEQCIITAKKELHSDGIHLSHLAAIHHETTSGILNDSHCLGSLCNAHGIEFILDAMSSYGAMSIDMNKDGIHYLVSSSNKNIQGMAGVGIIICNRQSLETTKDIPKRNLYLNLYEQYEYFLNTKQFRFTPPVQTLYALKQAVDETLAEGIENRYARYQESYRTMRKGMEEMGFCVLVDEKNSSGFITTFFDPQDMKYNFDTMHDFFMKKGFTIYPGKVSKANTFRIANIGQINKDDMLVFLNAMKEYLIEYQIKI